MNKTILLVDGDILAFRMSAAIDTRSILVTHAPTRKQKIFKNRTELKNVLKEKGKPEAISEYLIEDLVESEDPSHCMYSIKSRLNKLKELTDADKVEVYIGGEKNFRNDLLLPTKYKGTRDEVYRPTYLKEAKQYLIDVHGAMLSWEIEADDVLSVRGYEELSKGNRAIVASVDKDTLQANGLGFLDWTKEEPETFWIPKGGIGHLEYNGKKVVGHGLKFLAFQLLFGDPVDAYKPTELTGIKYGEKSALKDIQELSTSQEIVQKVLQKYKEWYPEPFDYTAWNGVEVKGATWETMLDLYFNCVWMRRAWDDKSNWRDNLQNEGWWKP